MPQIRIKAPAKLNLHLQIGDRRPDGFHDIESLFLALDFGDTLRVETVPRPFSLELCMDWQIRADLALSPEKNIVSRAVSLFRDRSGCEQGFKISLEKRIPLGGGLGGGSSDAAAALLALNQAADSADKGLLSGAELAEIGASLGSDVPFFLENRSAAWVSGRGEKIQPIVLPESAQGMVFVLVNPGFPSNTADAYRLLDLQREHGASHQNSQISHGVTENTELIQFSSPCPRTEGSTCPCASVRGPWDARHHLSKPPEGWPFFNDFLTIGVSDTHFPAYQQIISSLRELGADFAGLSGSGSTCFGVFCGREKAESARESLLLRWPFVIISGVNGV
jgi:4-diphosphocytidyl-2-C-methyl-D-erythritol kinase